MARARGNGSVRPTEDQPGFIRVQCPNLECGKRYMVPARYAGKRARCAECGTLTAIPAAPAHGLPTPAPAAELRTRPVRRAAPPAEPAVPEVRIGSIGRGHAGKTALFHTLAECLVGDFLRSGLHLDAADPRDVARMIWEADEARKLLRRSGLPPTLAPSDTTYRLYDGDTPLVGCRLREVVGQVLTHTLPDSGPRLQALYADYLKNLVNAHVLWTVVPCPPADPGPADRRRYANDLRITLAYLREALRLRTADRPAAVALVLTKTDALFDTPGQARAALTDDVLRQALGPLADLIETSAHVSDAAVFPVTAFGYGKAVIRPDGGERHGTEPGSADEPFGDEPIWLLREGESPEPDNLAPLFLWSLLLGLLNQAGAGARPEVEAVCRVWRDDLEAADPWLLPLKGGIALAAGEPGPRGRGG
jgi:hypothetical protein